MNMITAGRKSGIKSRSLLTILLALSIALSQTGCAPSYPKEIVDRAIIQLCREEYGLEVKVKIVKGTVGVYIPIKGLFDSALRISKEAADKLNDVILSVSRVTLSTDAPLEFYIVIAQDPILPDIEVVLVRYVQDIKLLHFGQISRGDFTKRMIINIKLTPQAQKEKALRNIFKRLNITQEDTDRLVAEYLKTAEVSSIGDIGYWQDMFYIKDISINEFLAMQAADRIRADFMNEAALKENFKLNAIKGEYLKEETGALFRFTINAVPAGRQNRPLTSKEAEEIYSKMLEVTAGVLYRYKFKNYRSCEFVNTYDNQALSVTQDELMAFRSKKTKFEELRRWYR